MYIIIILNGNTWRCVNKIASLCGPHLWFRFDSLINCHSSTDLSTAPKFRHSSWRASWQFCWILTSDLITFSQSVIIAYDTVYFVRNGADWRIRRDVPRDVAWWLPYREPCVRHQSPASTGLGRPENRRSRSGHIGKTRRRQPVVPIEREVVMKYLRHKFCGILCSVYVLFFFKMKQSTPK